MKNGEMDGMDGGNEPVGPSDRALAVLEAIGAGYLLSREGRILEVNDALTELLGYSKRELVGAELPWPFWPPNGTDVSPVLRSDLVRAGDERGRRTTLEVPLLHKDGSSFLGEVSIAPAWLPDGTALGWVSTIRDVSERRHHELELERLATCDPLTGLSNRRLFEQRLDAELADAIRHKRQVAVAILDLDNFKNVNDRYGHPAGDRTLKDVAARLEATLRKGDLLARVGGEEFAWILPEIYADGAFAAAERARTAIGSKPFLANREGIPLTVSIGVAMRGDLREAARLYERADQALYSAKRLGRDRSVIWSSMHDAVPAPPPVR